VGEFKHSIPEVSWEWGQGHIGKGAKGGEEGERKGGEKKGGERSAEQMRPHFFLARKVSALPSTVARHSGEDAPLSKPLTNEFVRHEFVAHGWYREW